MAAPGLTTTTATTAASAAPAAGAAAAAAWTPEPAKMQLVVKLLSAARTTTKNEERAAIEAELLKNSQAPEFNLYLVYLLAHGGSHVETATRQGAGLLLKQNVAQYAAWPAAIQTIVKDELIRAVGDADKFVRNTVGIVVTHILAMSGGLERWKRLLPQLVSMLDPKVPDNAVDGAFRTLLKLCEDYPDDMEAESLGFPLNALIPRCIAYFDSPNASFRTMALECVVCFVLQMPAALAANIESYLQGLSKLTADPDPAVREQVCMSLVSLTDDRLDMLMPHIDAIISFMLHSCEKDTHAVKKAACEFWASFIQGAHRDHLKVLVPYFPKLLPVLLDNMVYSEEELADLPSEDVADADVKDKDQDVAPYVYRGRGGGGGGAGGGAGAGGSDSDDDDDGFDDGEVASSWTLRKCAASTMDLMAVHYRHAMLQPLLPHLNDRFSVQGDADGVWQKREAGILAFGAVVEANLESMTPFLPKLFPFLVQLMDDKRPLVRSISCWASSRLLPWLVHMDPKTHHEPLLRKLLPRMLDHNKKVQEAACSALTSFAEHAGAQLAPYLDSILKCYAVCFTKYQAHNLLILYDSVGTMCDNVGPAIRDKKYAAQLLPPLYKLWNEITDDDKALQPLLECMTSVAKALGLAFLESAPPVFVRCVRLLQDNLVAIAAAKDLGEPIEDGSPVFDFTSLSLDLLDGLVEGLGPNFEALTRGSAMLNLVFTCTKVPDPGVRQSVFALAGELAQHCPGVLVPALKEFMQMLVLAMDPEVLPVCNNAVWAIGLIAKHLGEPTKPYCAEIMKKMAELVNRDVLDPALRENTAIAIGRLALTSPDTVAPLLDSFFPKDVGEKSDAFHGLFAMLKLNARSVAPHFVLLCEAIKSWTRPSAELVAMFKQIVAAFKQAFGTNWPQMEATFQKPLKDFMTMHYGM